MAGSTVAVVHDAMKFEVLTDLIFAVFAVYYLVVINMKFNSRLLADCVILFHSLTSISCTSDLLISFTYPLPFFD